LARALKRRKARNERKEEFLRIRVTREQKAALEAAARRETLDVSAWVRQVLLRAAGWEPGTEK
jgi:uncharacterized protein (DUF1778 family)